MRLIQKLLLAAGFAAIAGTTMAQGIDDPTRAPYYNSFKGKPSPMYRSPWAST